MAVAQTGFQGMAGQKNNGESRKERPTGTAGRDGIILPPDPAIPRQVAPQQSLLPFHRTPKCSLHLTGCHKNFKTRQTRLPGRGIQISSISYLKAAHTLEITTITRQKRISETSIRTRNQFNTGWF